MLDESSEKRSSQEKTIPKPSETVKVEKKRKTSKSKKSQSSNQEHLLPSPEMFRINLSKKEKSFLKVCASFSHSNDELNALTLERCHEIYHQIGSFKKRLLEQRTHKLDKNLDGNKVYLEQCQDMLKNRAIQLLMEPWFEYRLETKQQMNLSESEEENFDSDKSFIQRDLLLKKQFEKFFTEKELKIGTQGIKMAFKHFKEATAQKRDIFFKYFTLLKREEIFNFVEKLDIQYFLSLCRTLKKNSESSFSIDQEVVIISSFKETTVLSTYLKNQLLSLKENITVHSQKAIDDSIQGISNLEFENCYKLSLLYHIEKNLDGESYHTLNECLEVQSKNFLLKFVHNHFAIFKETRYSEIKEFEESRVFIELNETFFHCVCDIIRTYYLNKDQALSIHDYFLNLLTDSFEDPLFKIIHKVLEKNRYRDVTFLQIAEVIFIINNLRRNYQNGLVKITEQKNIKFLGSNSTTVENNFLETLKSKKIGKINIIFNMFIDNWLENRDANLSLFEQKIYIEDAVLTASEYKKVLEYIDLIEQMPIELMKKIISLCVKEVDEQNHQEYNLTARLYLKRLHSHHESIPTLKKLCLLYLHKKLFRSVDEEIRLIKTKLPGQFYRKLDNTLNTIKRNIKDNTEMLLYVSSAHSSRSSLLWLESFCDRDNNLIKFLQESDKFTGVNEEVCDLLIKIYECLSNKLSSTVCDIRGGKIIINSEGALEYQDPQLQEKRPQIIWKEKEILLYKQLRELKSKKIIENESSSEPCDTQKLEEEILTFSQVENDKKQSSCLQDPKLKKDENMSSKNSWFKNFFRFGR